MWRLSPPVELDSPKAASAVIADLARATPRKRTPARAEDAVASAALGGAIFVWRNKRGIGFVPRPVFAGRVEVLERGCRVHGAFVTPGLLLGPAFALGATIVAGAAGLAASLLPSLAIFALCRFISARLLFADEAVVLAALEAAVRVHPRPHGH
jgi:hypothetical protein